jgi:hypothetical protein
LIAARKARSAGFSEGSSSARRSWTLPSCTPAKRSFRYSRAQLARPESTGAGNVKTRLVTFPVDVITTTITVRACRSRTST